MSKLFVVLSVLCCALLVPAIIALPTAAVTDNPALYDVNDEKATEDPIPWDRRVVPIAFKMNPPELDPKESENQTVQVKNCPEGSHLKPCPISVGTPLPEFTPYKVADPIKVVVQDEKPVDLGSEEPIIREDKSKVVPFGTEDNNDPLEIDPKFDHNFGPTKKQQKRSPKDPFVPTERSIPMYPDLLDIYHQPRSAEVVEGIDPIDPRYQRPVPVVKRSVVGGDDNDNVVDPDFGVNPIGLVQPEVDHRHVPDVEKRSVVGGDDVDPDFGVDPIHPEVDHVPVKRSVNGGDDDNVDPDFGIDPIHPEVDFRALKRSVLGGGDDDNVIDPDFGVDGPIGEDKSSVIGLFKEEDDESEDKDDAFDEIDPRFAPFVLNVTKCHEAIDQALALFQVKGLVRQKCYYNRRRTRYQCETPEVIREVRDEKSGKITERSTLKIKFIFYTRVERMTTIVTGTQLPIEDDPGSSGEVNTEIPID